MIVEKRLYDSEGYAVSEFPSHDLVIVNDKNADTRYVVRALKEDALMFAVEALDKLHPDLALPLVEPFEAFLRELAREGHALHHRSVEYGMLPVDLAYLV